MARDVHDDPPGFPIPVSWVGIGWVRLPPARVGGALLMPRVKALVSLPESMRGAHLSRSYRAIAEARGASPLDVPEAVAEALLGLHEYARRAMAALDAEGLHEPSGRAFRLKKAVALERGRGLAWYEAAVSVVTATACPCALEVSRELFGAPYTHTQRVVLEARLRSGLRPPVGELELLEALMAAAPGLPPYAKREGEAEFLKSLYSRPMFAEDLVREAARLLLEKLRGARGVLRVRAVSLESIHEYNVEAVLVARLGG